MKTFFNLFLFLCLFLTSNLSFAFDFKDTDTKKYLKSVTESYNKNLKVTDFLNSKLDFKTPFLKDFQIHLKSSGTKNFWKAEIVGDTVYFKNDKQMISLKVVEMVNTSHFIMKLNGKNVSLNMKESFAKNLQLMKGALSANPAKAWNLIIPQAIADDLDMPSELEDGLSSALSWGGWVSSFVTDDIYAESERICTFDKNEISNPETYVALDKLGDQTLLNQIQYFIRFQNAHVKPQIEASQTCRMGECTNPKANASIQIQACLERIVVRRSQAIGRGGNHVLGCLKKFEDGRLYLSSELLQPTALISSEDTMEAKERSLSRCNGWDSCKKPILAEIAKLKKRTCPFDDKELLATQPGSYGGASGGGSRSAK